MGSIGIEKVEETHTISHNMVHNQQVTDHIASIRIN